MTYYLNILALTKVVMLGAAMTPVASLAQSAGSSATNQYADGGSESDENTMIVALGAGIAPTYDGSDNYRIIPGGLAIGRVSGFDVMLRGPSFSIDLVRDPSDSPVNFIFGPVVQARFERSHGIEDSRVRALGEKDVALELGARVGIGKRGVLNGMDMLSLEASFVQDVTDVHDSYLITPTINYRSPVADRTMASFNLASTYAGKGYGRTYFDVPLASSAVSGLASYATSGSGFKDVGASVMLMHSFGDDAAKGWGLFASGGYKRLLGRYADSPIVADAGDPDQAIGLIGVTFKF